MKQSEYRPEHRNIKTKMPQPHMYQIKIQTPKSNIQSTQDTSNTIHNTSWRDNELVCWKLSSEQGQNIPLQEQEDPEERIAQKWDNMTHTSKNRVDNMSNDHNETTIVNLTVNMIFNICTEIIHNDTGVDRAVTSNQSIMVSYEDIALFQWQVFMPTIS